MNLLKPSPVDTDGIRPDTDKVAAILLMKKPTNVTELRHFLGMINHLSKFLTKFADLSDQGLQNYYSIKPSERNAIQASRGPSRNCEVLGMSTTICMVAGVECST